MIIYLMVGLILWVVFDMVDLIFDSKKGLLKKLGAGAVIWLGIKMVMNMIQAYSLFWSVLLIYCIVLLTKGVKAMKSLK